MPNSSGFSFLEIQVSLVLVSVSVVGIARLQIETQSDIDHAYYVGQAYELIEETSRRIYLNSEHGQRYLIDDLSRVSSFSCNPCSPEQLVSLDHAHLANTLISTFPGASARVFSCPEGICMAVAWFDADVNSCASTEFCIERPVW